MKVLVLNGARAGEKHIDVLAEQVDAQLQQRGWQTTHLTLREQAIKSCIGCFKCWVDTPGECIANGDNRRINALTMQSDVLLFITPVVFGGYSSEFKKALDHQIPLIMPFFKRIHGEVHHAPRYERYPALVGIGVQASRNPRQAQLFRDLVARNGLNLHAPYAQGVTWLTEDLPNAHTANIARLLAQIEEALS